MQTSVVLLYNNSKLSEREIKKTISFTINLNKEVNNLYLKSCKMLTKESEEKDRQFSQIGRINLIKNMPCRAHNVHMCAYNVCVCVHVSYIHAVWRIYCIHTMECHSAMEKNETLPSKMAWLD